MQVYPVINKINSLVLNPVNNLEYIENICKIHTAFNKLVKQIRYFRVINYNELFDSLNNHILQSIDKFIIHIASNGFNYKKLCELFDVLITHKITMNINKLFTDYFSDTKHIVGGNNITHDELINSNVVTHDNIIIVLDNITKKYNISEEAQFDVNINVIINMYKFILQNDNRKFLTSNMNSLLFQMDKFWNNQEMDKLLTRLPDAIHNKLVEIQYLASCSKCLITKNYEDFTINKLELENLIKAYLVKKFIN